MFRSSCLFRFVYFLILISIAESNADIIHVPAEYSLIQDAFNFSTEGDTVLLAPGYYEESVVLSNHGITLASNFIFNNDTTTVQHTIMTSVEGHRTITIDTTVTTSFTAIGLSFLNSNFVTELSVGSVLYADTITVNINNCIVSNNIAYFSAIHTNYSDLYLYNNLFSFNTALWAGGAVSVNHGHIHFENNRFINNISEDYAGAISTISISGEIINNIFDSNYAPWVGGAIHVGSPSDYPETESLTIFNNLFRDNTASQGGALNFSWMDELDIYDNIFVNNVAWDISQPSIGGAMFIGAGGVHVDIHDNEFYHNSSLMEGAVTIFMSSADFHDNLLFRNRGDIKYVLGTINTDSISVIIHDNLIFESSRINPDYPYDRGAVSADPGANMDVYHNDFIGNQGYAAGRNPVWDVDLDVLNNYWGDPTGPYHETQNPLGMGDTVMSVLDVIPFSISPFTTRWLHAPQPLELVLPVEGDFLSEDTVTFLWHTAPDSTPHDTLRYTLIISDSPEFTTVTFIDTDTDTATTVTGLNWEYSYYWRVEARDIYDLRTYSTETRSFMLTEVPEPQTAGLPREWAIDHIYPNPFNRMTQIVLSVPGAATSIPVQVDIFDLQGRLVDTLHGGVLAAGQRRLLWQPKSAAGMYFIRVTAGNWQAMRKVVYLK